MNSAISEDGSNILNENTYVREFSTSLHAPWPTPQGLYEYNANLTSISVFFFFLGFN
jgi:hypothetical protein